MWGESRNSCITGMFMLCQSGCYDENYKSDIYRCNAVISNRS